MHIVIAKPKEHSDLLRIWESSVRATHAFLSEDDIEFFKSKMLSEFFPVVALYSAKDSQGRTIGFIGLSTDSIEMLFIAPEYRGQGVGKLLVNYATNHHQASKVDVNEQNIQAFAFYQRMGFVTVNRSAIDSMGKPYPILHMQLTK